MPTYATYIASDEWKAKRAVVLKRANGWCEACGKRRAVQVHHKTYRHLFKEPLEDLIALCVSCHQKKHPDKFRLIGRPIFAEIFQCGQCESTTADLYLAGPWKMFVCHGCGETTTQRRNPSKEKTRRSRRRKANGPKHKRTVHGARPATKKKPKKRDETFDQIVARQRAARESQRGGTAHD